MGDPDRPAPRPSLVPAEDDAPDAAQAAELSRAAREAVRQPADPRIDRQLAWLGLGPEDGPEDRGPVEHSDPVGVESPGPDVATLRAKVDSLSAELEGVRGELASARDADEVVRQELEAAQVELTDARTNLTDVRGTLEDMRATLDPALARARLLTAIALIEAVVIAVLAALVVLR